jgi:hypothetical protein
MFDIDTPHSGLANYSEKYFRLSMDIRVMGASGKVPVIGKLIAVSRRNIEVGDGHGRVHRFALDEATYCRGLDGKKMSLAQIPEQLVAGQELIVAHSDGRAEVIRPPH